MTTRQATATEVRRLRRLTRGERWPEILKSSGKFWNQGDAGFYTSNEGCGEQQVCVVADLRVR